MAISAKAINRKYWKLMPLGQNSADAETGSVTRNECFCCLFEMQQKHPSAALRIFILATAPVLAAQILATPAMSLPAHGRCAARSLPALRYQ